MMDDEMCSRNYPARNVGRSYVEDDDHENDMDDDGVERMGKDEDDDDFGDLHSKKRKFKTVLSSYEFAPRLPSASYGGRNAHVDWSEDETLILLNAWGERFLKKEGKNILYDEWLEVAEKVSQESKIERTCTQCRNRVDTLKKQYKKEKMKFNDDGNSGSKWIYFEKMDALLSSGGEHVFRNTKSYMDEGNDSPAHSEGEFRGPLNLVADSVRKITEIYDKVESGIRRKMVELEKMRTEFYRDLEFQKREIWERAQAEIDKIRHDDDDKNSG